MLNGGRVLENQIVLQVALGGVEHEGLVFGQFQLDPSHTLATEYGVDGVLEEIAPLNSAFHISHQHPLKDVSQFWANVRFFG